MKQYRCVSCIFSIHVTICIFWAFAYFIPMWWHYAWLTQTFIHIFLTIQPCETGLTLALITGHLVYALQRVFTDTRQTSALVDIELAFASGVAGFALALPDSRVGSRRMAPTPVLTYNAGTFIDVVFAV